MRTLDSWFAEYGESHRHPVNQRIHKVCVPAIFFSILAILRAIPAPSVLGGVHQWALNWATVSLPGPLLFYFLLDRRLFAWMLAQIGLMLLCAEWLHTEQLALPVGLGLFTLAWAGQFYGHQIEGRKPSFFKDLAFLLIGPLWVTRGWLKGKAL
jgi:uncharacterized membrane protein YGL010W